MTQELAQPPMATTRPKPNVLSGLSSPNLSTVRTCKVKAHDRRIAAKPSMLDNPIHRQLALEVKAAGHKGRVKAKGVRA